MLTLSEATLDEIDRVIEERRSSPASARAVSWSESEDAERNPRG